MEFSNLNVPGSKVFAIFFNYIIGLNVHFLKFSRDKMVTTIHDNMLKLILFCYFDVYLLNHINVPGYKKQKIT